MGEHSSENYLDQLLNSMGLDEPAEKKIERPVTPQEQLERDLFGEPVTKEKAKAKDEEDFLREFEEELLEEDIPDYTNSLKENLKKEKASEIDASLDELLNNLPKAHPSEETAEPQVDYDALFSGKLPDEPESKPDSPAASMVAGEDDGFEVNTLDNDVGDFDRQLSQNEEGELDLSGLSDSNLLDMLSSDADLSDLGDMLSQNENGTPVEEGDSIGDFAESEMSSRENDTESVAAGDESAGEETSSGKGKRKKSKKEKKAKNQEGKKE